MSSKDTTAAVTGYALALWGSWDAIRLSIFAIAWYVTPGSDFAISLMESIVVKSFLGPLALVIAVEPWGVEAITALVSLVAVGLWSYRRPR